MSLLDSLTNAIMTMEGSNNPNSVNQHMISTYGLYDPGHLVYAGQVGATPVKIGSTVWAGFSTLEDGIQAIKNQITLDASRGNTLETFIGKYAPPSQNDTGSYLNYVSSQLGVDPTTKLSDIVGSVSDSISSVFSSSSDLASQYLNELGSSGSSIGMGAILLIGGAIALGVLVSSQ